ncbi:MAG: DUF4062 domain-containing protein, partial [Methanobrevibacter sp.]|nr:DUF4062 domain-containing protein [Methanobrevibacter sp.]
MSGDNNKGEDGLATVELVSKTFRVFVSSTFDDLKVERDALQKNVFPRLKKLCEDKHFSFQAIDLRWGVSDEAQYNQKTMKICLDEIERCQVTTPKPNFIVLLGNRYGWNPLPYEIKKEEYEQIYKLIEHKKDKAIFDKWYKCDENSVPPKYILQPRTGKYRDPDDSKPWTEVEERIRTILQDKVLEIYNRNDEIAQKYFTSATEQEVIKGVLNPNSKNHAFAFFREIKTENPKYHENLKSFFNFDKDGNIDEKNVKLVTKLKNQLKSELSNKVYFYESDISNESKKNTITYDHIEKFCDDVYDSLSKTILRQIQDYEENPLEKEIRIHNNFAKKKSKGFVGRKDIIKKINDYVNSDNDRPLAVVGESGLGKTALLAHISQTLKKSDKKIVSRYIGASPRSFNIVSLLDNIAKEVVTNYFKDIQMTPEEYQELINQKVPDDYRKLLEECRNILGLAIGHEQLVIFIDAVNQLSEIENSQELAWLPTYLPKNVKIIISTIYDNSEENKTMKAINNKIPKENIKTLAKMELNDGKYLLNSWLKEANRTLTKDQKNEIIEKFKVSSSPLFLMLAFEEVLHWKSDTQNFKLPETITELINHSLKRLSSDENHGRILTTKTLAYLASSRNGLSENEMIEILSRDKEVMDDYEERKSTYAPKIEKLPFIIWSRLYFDLKPYLIEKDNANLLLINFYHQQINQTIEHYYLKNNKEFFHEKLTEYFEEKPRKLWDLEFFIKLHDNDFNYYRYYLHCYWAEIENSTKNTLKKSYQRIMNNLSKYNTPGIFLLARFLQDTGHLDYASQIYKYTTQIAKQQSNKSDLQNSLGNQANIYHAWGELEESMKLHKEVEEICRELNNKDSLQVSLGNQANIYYAWGEFEEAMKLLKEVEEICRELNNKDSLQVSLGNQALTLKDWGEFEEAMKLLKRQEEICRELNNKDSLQVSLGNQALIYDTWGELEKAMKLHK